MRQSPHWRNRYPENQKTYSLLKTLPDIHSQRVANVHVAEKPSNIIAIRGYATFVDKQLIGVMVIMIDLISRKDAIDLEYIVKNINGVDYVMLSEVQMKLRKMPSAEPEIIHCNDCIHWINKHLCEIWSRYGTIETKPDFYCGFGERINNE